MNIVILDGYLLNPGDLSWESLHQLGKVTVHERTPEEHILERAWDADILLTNKCPLSAATIKQLPKLKYIGVLATGYDVVDVKAAAEQGIIVSNVPTYGTDSVAQFVFALLLELCHHVGAHSESVKSGDWASAKDWCYWNHPLVELSGKTMGIIGLGRIGIKVAQIANVMGMNVVAAQHKRHWTPPIERFQWVSQEQLLADSDVISLHCPLTKETEGFINRTSLSQMKTSAFLINTARGKLIHEADLAEALNQGVIAGAGLDVLSAEPPVQGSPLMQASNCIITPHIAWASKEARGRLLDTAIHNIQAFINHAPVHVVS